MHGFSCRNTEQKVVGKVYQEITLKIENSLIVLFAVRIMNRGFG